MIIFRVEDVAVQNRKTLTMGNLLINGKLFKAVSGGWGKGALPQGIYTVVPARKLPDTKENVAYKKEGFPWVAGLMPQFDTDRTNLAIHADGNVPGSLGCIVIQVGDIEAYNLLANIKSEMLKVI